MQQHEFFDGLGVLYHLQQHELVAHGVIDDGDTGAWIDFTRDRIRWALHALPLRAERIWNLIGGKVPSLTVADDAADALHEIDVLSRGFGRRECDRLYPWLKAHLRRSAGAPLENL